MATRFDLAARCSWCSRQLRRTWPLPGRRSLCNRTLLALLSLSIRHLTGLLCRYTADPWPSAGPTVLVHPHTVGLPQLVYSSFDGPTVKVHGGSTIPIHPSPGRPAGSGDMGRMAPSPPLVHIAPVPVPPPNPAATV